MVSSGLVEDLLIIAVETSLLTIFLRNSLNKRWRFLVTLTVLLCLQFVRRVFVIGTVTVVLSYALDIAVAGLAFYGKLEKKIFILSLFYAAVIVFDMASIMLTSPLLRLLPSTFPDAVALLIPATVVSKAMTFLLILIVGDALQTRIHIPKWLAYVPLPALTVVAIALLNPLTGEAANSTVAMLLTVICVIGLFAHVYMLVSIRRTSQYNELDYRLRMSGELKALRKQYMIDLQAAYRHIERTAHDLKHHLGYLRNAPDLESVQRYIAEIDSRSFSEILNYTGNYDVDTILNAKRQNMLHATLKVCGTLPDEIDWLDSVDISIILGNALDNAIEACESRQSGEITIRFKYDGWLLLTMENPTDLVPVLKKFGVGFMSTKGKPGHGIGLESMEMAIKRYDGHIEYKVTENGVFHLSIMLQ